MVHPEPSWERLSHKLTQYFGGFTSSKGPSRAGVLIWQERLLGNGAEKEFRPPEQTLPLL